MDKNTFINEIIEKYLPDDADLIGPGNIRAIINGNIKFEKPENALNIDLTTSIQLIIGLVTFINNVWGIYDKWSSHQKSLNQEELKKELLKSCQLPTELERQFDALATEIIQFKEKSSDK